MKKTTLTICLFVLLSLQAYGENCRVDKCDTNIVVRGHVLEKASGKPIKNANIFTRGCGKQSNCLADANGFFEIPACLTGYFRFYVTAEGYTSRTIDLRIEKDKATAEQKVELSPSSKVAGFVKNEAGEPVCGAVVKTFHFTNQPVETDANGFYEIDGLDPVFGNYSIHVESKDYPAASVRFTPAEAGTTGRCDVLLKSGVTIYGQVTDPDGKAVSGAEVGDTTSRCMWNCTESQTDANGYYRLRNIEKGELVLWAVHPEYPPFVERFLIGDKDTERRIDIRFEKPKPLRGKIVDKQGNGIEGVNVGIREVKGVSNLSSYRDRLKTDKHGKFIIENAPPRGRITLEIWSDDVPNTMPEVETSKDEHVIEVDRAGKIYGRVVADATGEPVSKFNVKLGFSQKSKIHASGYSSTWSESGYNFQEPNGLFDTGRENLPIGAGYAVTVYSQGYDPLTIDPVEVQPESDVPDREIFRLTPATMVPGRVFDSNDIAIAGATVRWFSETNRLYQQGERWDDGDTTMTDVEGRFSFNTIGTGKRGIYITARGYAPYVNSDLMIPDDVNELSRIVLEKGANIVGTVFKEGCPHVGVEMSCDLNNRYNLNRMGYIDKRNVTDTEGNYTFSDLPGGEIRIYMMSPAINRTSYTLASKMLNLQPGETARLDFGNEKGFMLTGRVTMGQSFLSSALVSFRKEGFYKAAVSDSNGFFKITGLEKGQYEVRTEHSEPGESKSGCVAFCTADRITDTRQIQVDSDMNVTIDFSTSSLGGKIPAEFINSQGKYVSVSARKWQPQEQTYLRDMTYRTNWQYGGSSRPDADGNFEIRNLRPGKYFLVLSEGGRLLAVSKILELGDSEKIDDINLAVPKAKLRVVVVDAQDKKPVAAATAMLYNKDLELQFSGLLEGYPQAANIFTDANGVIEYVNLPQGNYTLSSGKKGYLTSETEIEIDSDETVEEQIALEESAIVQFELAPDVNESITKPMAYMYLKVTNVKSGELYTVPTRLGQMKEMFVYLKRLPCNPPDYVPDPYIDLPTGRYRIDYGVFQDEIGNHDDKCPMVSGQADVDVTAGRTTKIVIKRN